ncbi:MAG TPA: M12 family metallo-peptidase [Pyrinomonadaceae bacterium]|jgi:hypothetical protein
MKKASILILFLLVSAFFCLFYLESSKAQSAQDPVELFNLVSADKSVNREKLQTRLSTAEVRRQEISLNLDSINFEMSQRLSLPLLDGKSYLAIRRDSEGFVRLGANEFSWRGKITSANGSSGDVILTVKDKALSGLIYSDAGVYEIVPQADFRHVLVEIEQGRFAPCGGALQAPEDGAALQGSYVKNGSDLRASADVVAPDNGSQIDVLVVYTTQVRTALGGTTQTETFIQQAISSTNTAYQNSGINPRLRLVGSKEVPYDEAAGTLNAALNWVRTDAAVAAERNAVKADLVALITEEGGGLCGLAYVQRSVGAGFSGAAFSATSRSCAVGNLSFAHELGHNEGCEHNPENGAAPGEASYPYAFGHYVDGSFRTVMSYTDPCTGGCKRIPYFSNPSINFNGLPTGIPNERDNHRVINNTASIVALFRDSGGVSPTPTPTPTPVPTPTPTPAPAPNLAAYHPSGWTEKIVVSNVTGTNTQPASLLTTDTLYVDWAVINNGDSPTAATFSTKLYVDGVERQSWNTASPLSRNFYTYVQDYPIGSLSIGPHTVRIVTDAGGAIAEKSEADNEFDRAFTIFVGQIGNTIQLDSPVYSFNEASVNTAQGFGALTVTVTRTNATAPASVQFATSDISGGNECNQVSGQASQRCDYAAQAGTLSFAAGESSKTLQIPIISDGYIEGPELFFVKLQNAVGATLGLNSQATITIVDRAVATLPAANPYLSNEFFVRLNYLDFLGREPDAGGWSTWPPLLNSCGPEKGFLGAPYTCDRAHVSHGFYASPEFTNRGFLVYRLYEVGMGRLPRYVEFIPDMANLSGFGLPDAIQQQNLAEYLQNFTNRAEFVNRFQGALQNSDAELLIQRLEQASGVSLPASATTLPGQPTQYGRQELINKRSSGELTVGQTLKAFVEQQAVYDRFFPRGAVTMEYFAYLKRDPDLNDPNLVGWNEWVFVFTNGGAARGRPDILPRDIHHLIFGFIYSEEYRKRFGAP